MGRHKIKQELKKLHLIDPLAKKMFTSFLICCIEELKEELIDAKGRELVEMQGAAKFLQHEIIDELTRVPKERPPHLDGGYSGE